MTLPLVQIILMALTIVGVVFGIIKREFSTSTFWFWNVVCWAIVLRSFML